MAHQRNYIDMVKVIYVTKPKQKIQFQIKHPENAQAITEIAVSTTMIREKSKTSTSSVAGILSLAIGQKGDVAFGDAIRVDDNNYLDELTKNVTGTFFNKSFWFAGKKQTFYKTRFNVKEAVLEGFYEDLALPLSGFVKSIYGGSLNVNDAKLPPLNERYYYVVRIYIRYTTRVEKV